MKIPKLIAFYFPQFHPIEQNDIWWGENFTDWNLVKDAKPLFQGHNQPRIPKDKIYYNPTNAEVLRAQAEMAKKHHVSGFMFYHYWFDGELMLQKPMEVFLQNKDIDIEFCVTWANESWTRAWTGQPEVYLKKQLHTTNKQLWKSHFEYLLPFFKDSRALKINNNPVFLIYQPFLIKNSEEMLAYWQELAKQNGLEKLYVIAIKNHDFLSSDFLKNYDGIMNFQPREAYTSKDFQSQNISARFQFLRKLPHLVQLYVTKFYQKISSHKIYDSTSLWNIILLNSFKNKFPNFKLDVFESAFFEWDNTPRYKKRAKIFTELSDDDKKKNLKILYKNAILANSDFLFFNAWNEWSESSYLEPDEKNGFKNLEIIEMVVNEITEEYK